MVPALGKPRKVDSPKKKGAKGAFGPFKKVASLQAQGPLGPLGPFKKSLRSGIPQNGQLHLLFHARKSPEWAASPPILGGSGHKIKCVADHFGAFRAWIPERSDFFKGPKGPKGPLGLERSDLPQTRIKKISPPGG